LPPPTFDDRLQSWLVPDASTPGRRSLHALVDRLRGISVSALYVDGAALAPGDLDEALAAAAALAAALDALGDTRHRGTPAGSKEAPTLLPERSPVSGASNVAAPPMRLEHHDGFSIGRVVFSEIHEGPAGHAHGGMVAAIFDELLGVAQVHSGAAGYTVELDVRYRKITPLLVPIIYRADVASREGRVIKVHATSYAESAPDVELASAEGTFITQRFLPIPDELQGT
jgi:acyl-coenzyme A thioesterase PaaI-like protein